MPFNREMLPEQMKDKCPMYLMEIVKCTNRGVDGKIHEEAEPFLARALTTLTKRVLLADDTSEGQAEGRADADSISDDHFRVTWRGGIGFTVISPAMIQEGMANISTVIAFRSSTGVSYEVRYKEFSGNTIMKAKDKEVVSYGFGEIPPTALQYPDVNTPEALEDSFKNALNAGGLKWQKVQVRLNAAGKPTNKYVVQWKKPEWQNRTSFYKAMKVPLPSTDEGTITFSGVFCTEFDLHMYCGHARMNGTCTHCGPDPKMNSKKAIKKRSFDDLFGELN